MSQIHFHSATIISKPVGTAGTPIQLKTVQEVSIDFKFGTKELMGENMFAEAIGRGSAALSGKIKTGQMQARYFNDSVLGGNNTLLSEGRTLALNEAGTPAASAVTVANAANYVKDWGVKETSTGLPLTRVASAPTTGQYSVNETTGVYTFAAGDTTAKQFTYQYRITTPAGQVRTMQVNNQIAGEAPLAELIVVNKFQSKEMHNVFYGVVYESLGFSHKLEDFAMPEISFKCQANSAGRVWDQSVYTFG
jgi:hypothetical protein